jgi:hypothetical protein
MGHACLSLCRAYRCALSHKLDRVLLSQASQALSRILQHYSVRVPSVISHDLSRYNAHLDRRARCARGQDRSERRVGEILEIDKASKQSHSARSHSQTEQLVSSGKYAKQKGGFIYPPPENPKPGRSAQPFHRKLCSRHSCISLLYQQGEAEASTAKRKKQSQ